jgi:hypothetical protein
MTPDETHKSEYVSTQTPLSHSTRAGYEIRVKDHLDTWWWHWFEGWTITNLEDGEVLLSHENADQSALHGALNKVRDLNLNLLSVTRTGPGK